MVSQVYAPFPEHLLEGLDLSAFDELSRSAKEQHDSRHKRDQPFTQADLKLWIVRAWKEASRLKLGSPPHLDILDLGTGPAYFLYVCQRLGHRCVGLDQPGFFPFWQRLHQWLGIRRVVEHAVQPNGKLPADLGRFDLVTAYRSQFNYNAAERRLWNIAEWAFFLDDLRDNVLKPGGRFVLRLTKQEVRGKAGLKRDDPVLVGLLRERGAQESKGVMIFDPLT